MDVFLGTLISIHYLAKNWCGAAALAAKGNSIGSIPPFCLKTLFFISPFLIKIHSKWVHPVIKSFGHCTCQVLVQAPVLTCLQLFFFQFLKEMRDVCVQKENTLSCQCNMDNGDSTFYPPFP